jgi:ATP-dependent RNA helicase DHX29
MKLMAETNWACDSPLLPPSLPSPPPKPAAKASEPASDQPSPRERSPLFREAASDESASDSDSDDEPNLDKANQTWAKLMLELDAMRSGPDGKKGKKKKGPAVVLETPEIRRIKNEMAKVEKEYMFSRKEAGKFLDVSMADDRCHIQVSTGSS